MVLPVSSTASASPCLHQKVLVRRRPLLVFLSTLIPILLVFQATYNRNAAPTPTTNSAQATTIAKNVINVPSLSSRSLEPLQAMWNCTNDNATNTNETGGRQKKLLFVHVFKTAGTSFRKFFLDYGKKCQDTGVTILVGCDELKEYEQLGEMDAWAEHHGRACRIENFRTRNRQPKTQQAQLTRSFLHDTTDVLIGHYPLGTHDHWVINNNDEKDDEYQYITFFRDPLQKLASAYVFIEMKVKGRMDLTTEQAIEELYEQVHQHCKGGQYHDGYSLALLTPTQKRISRELFGYNALNWTKNETIVQYNMAHIKKNLVELNVMVGIVEQMKTSLALLGFLIDGRGELQAAMAKLDSSGSVSSASLEGQKQQQEQRTLHVKQQEDQEQQHQDQRRLQKMVINQSKLNTSEVARRVIEKDPELIKEYLHYEMDLYNYAVQLHAKQYEVTFDGEQEH